MDALTDPVLAQRTRLPALPARATQDTVAKVAVAFEAVFLAETLGHAGLGEARGPFGGGAGEDAFSGMLVREYARSIAESGGTGIAEGIERALRSGKGGP